MSEITHNPEKLYNALRNAENQIAQLNLEKDLYYSILDTQSEYICRFTPDYTLLYANRSYCERLGKPLQELIGRSIFEWIPTLEHDKARNHISQLNDSMRSASMIRRTVNPDGTHTWIEWTDIVVQDQRGEIIAYQGIGRDVSTQRRIEQELRETASLYRVIVETTNEGVWLEDTSGITLYVNQQMADMLGYTPEEMIGRPVTAFVNADQQAEIVSKLKQRLQGIGDRYDFRFRRKDGKDLWVGVSSVPSLNEQGEVIGIVTMLNDITQRKQQEIVLETSISRYRALVQAIPDLIFRTDADTVFLDYYVGSASEMAIPPEVFLGKSAFELFPRELAERQYEATYTALEQGQPTQYEYEMFFKGMMRTYEARIAPVNSHEVLAIVRDITDRKQTENNLRIIQEQLEERVQQRTSELENERKLLRTLVESMPGFVYAKDRKHRFILANRALAQRYGCDDPEDLIGKTDREFLPEDQVTLFMQSEQALFDADEAVLNLEDHVTQQDGKSEWLLTNKVPLHTSNGEVFGLVGITIDISDRKRIEAVLEEKYQQERQLQRYLELLHAVMIELTEIDDLDHLYQRMVEFAVQQLEFDRFALFLYDPKREYCLCTYGVDDKGNIVAAYDLQMPLSFNPLIKMAMDDPTHMHVEQDAKLYSKLEGVGTGWNATFALVRGDETLGWIVADNLLKHQPINRIQLDVMAQYGMMIASILARKKIEDVLRESEATYRQLIETMGGGITIFDLQGNLTYVNDRMCEICGYTREQMLGTGFAQIIPADEISYFMGQTDRQQSNESGTYELSLQRTNGTRVTLLVNGSPLYNSKGQHSGSFAVSLDITHRKETEEALRRALEREKELGLLKNQFVTTTSHEFRTPLAIIQATAETLMHYRNKMDDQQINTRLEKIRGQVNHLRQIMDDVMELAKIQAGRIDYRPAIYNLDELCVETVEEFNSSDSTRDRVHYHAPEGSIRMAFDHRLLRQVINNLLSNALKYSKSEQAVEMTIEHDEQQVTIRIQDYGIGIPADSVNNVFVPFFRAENVGTIPGTGLGLAITRQAVEIHGGSIEFETELNKGTTFTVRLPYKTETMPYNSDPVDDYL